MGSFQDGLHQALTLHKGREFGKAEQLYSRLLGANPDDPVVPYLLGQLYLATNRGGIAIPMFEIATQRAPQMAEAWHDLGVAYKIEDHTDRARAAYERALVLEPNNAAVMAMMAGTYVNAGNPQPGIEWARKALEIDPDNPHARNHLALCLLETGSNEAWEHYKHRWEVPDRLGHRRDFGNVSRWDGRPVKRLAIHGEQGIGDEIMFLSCLPPDLPAALVLEVSPRLVPLMRRTFPAEEIYSAHEDVMRNPAPDAWLPMGDLPGMFAVDGLPYLIPDAARVAFWRRRLEALGPGPYIACAWGGGLKLTHRGVRNTDLSDWKPLLGMARFVSVDYREGAADEAFAAGLPHWQDAIDDLDEQAALISACDMTITACQTLVHLSGALGKPTWVLTPKACAWRYLYNCTETRMNWYPDAHLYRQETAGDWKPVIERIRSDLANHLPRLSKPESRAA